MKVISTFAQEVRRGLSRKYKQLAPKFLYDAHGSELFDRITRLPEYYPTRKETEILERVAESLLDGTQEIVELGAGYSRKTQILLDALEKDGGKRYVALDVSASAIEASAPRLIADHPKLQIEGFVADFEHSLDIVEHRGSRMVILLGSTIGNFLPEDRVDFLSRIQAMMAPGDLFLLGADLVKDHEILEAAYNDSQGLSAEFALNLIHVLNRELEGDLPIEAFEYVSTYDREHSRIDMRLRAKCEIDARLEEIDLDVHFDEGEELRTEVSTKFTREALNRDLASVGLEIERWETDRDDWFGLALIRRIED